MMDRVIGFLICAGILVLGIFYFNNLWLKVLFIGFGALGVIGTFIKDENDPYKDLTSEQKTDALKKIASNMEVICQNCGFKEDVNKGWVYVPGWEEFKSGINLYMSKEPKRVNDEGLDIYPLLCFKCNYISELASDPYNSSGKAKGNYEYFKKFPINKTYKKGIMSYAKQSGHLAAFTQTSLIKIDGSF